MKNHAIIEKTKEKDDYYEKDFINILNMYDSNIDNSL
jgi:hypothetical protein